MYSESRFEVDVLAIGVLTQMGDTVCVSRRIPNGARKSPQTVANFLARINNIFPDFILIIQKNEVVETWTLDSEYEWLDAVDPDDM